jgi:hypothetical protein
MAAGLGFKDFTTGEVLTANDVDGYLMQGVWVFASAAARDAAVTSPQEGNFAYLKDTNGTTYYTGSAWTNLSGGKVAQVVTATTATETTSTSTTYADVTGLSVSITPTSATSRILVTVSAPCMSYFASAGTAGISLQILRGASSIADFGRVAGGYAGGEHTGYAVAGLTYIDSPATTSATTYKVQLKAATSATAYVNRTGEQNLSTITVTEILA